MDTLTLSDAKNKRAHVRAAATRLKTFIDNFDTDNGSRHDLTERKQKLSDLWNQFEAAQSRIEMLENADPLIADKAALHDQQVLQRDSFEGPYFQLMARYTALIERIESNSSQSITSNVNEHAVNSRETRIKLPKIDLPVFTGAYDDWFSYRDVFEKLIHLNEGLSEIEKFHYLRSSLKDNAAEIIKSIETTAANYQDAWEAIKERFDNQRWLVQRHIRALFEVPTVRKENHNTIRELLDICLKHLRALKALKRPTEYWDDLIVHLIISKLDVATGKAWELSIKGKDLPDLKSLIEFLTLRCQALESVHSRACNSSLSSVTPRHSSSSKSTSVANVATSNLSCSVCKENHSVYHCKEFLNLSVENRVKAAKKAHLCLNCLRSTTHKSKECNSSNCRKCSKKHNTLLHLDVSNRSDQVESSTQLSSQDTKPPLPVATQCTSGQHSSNILLSTAVINVYDSNNQIHTCRALLDSGSQMNFITKELSEQLRLEERPFNSTMAGVMDGVIHANKIISLCVKSRFNNFCEKIDCVVLPKITQHLPQRFVPMQEVSIPKCIKLADPNFNVPASIDLLIGAELFWRLICAGQIKQSKNKPMLQKTHFGWVISGVTPTDITKPISSLNYHVTSLDELRLTLNQFWEVEHNIVAKPFSPEEKACEESFLQNTRRNEEGRFIVKLPIKQDKLNELGASRDNALKRFKSLERRLISQPEMYDQYRKFMNEYIQLNHMKEVNDSSIASPSSSVFYLPHHAVKNETSSTTKFRVVFDASCKSTSGLSLNDTLMVGPTLQQDLFSILIRFRTFKVVITADIAKMYRQVLVDSNQTALQRILWRGSPDEPIKTFELLTVTYGLASASYLAIRTLRKLAEENANRYPKASQITLRDFYVDDLVTGADSAEEALLIKKEITSLLQEGGFELRKWSSNIQAVQDQNFSGNIKEFGLSSEKNTEKRTLGIAWDCHTDEFKCASINHLPPLGVPTKRRVLSRIALIYDPLGLVGPITLLAKIIMQELWRLKLEWDEAIPLDLHTKWKRFETELQKLDVLRIPRLVITTEQHIQLELHGFADASENAYGACIYLCSTSINNERRTLLLCSKSRVAPLKGLSLPRLELCGAVLPAQLINKVSNCLNCQISSVYLWTDSTIVLSWLQSCSRSWSTFVAHRVGEIQELTSIHQWNHIRSEDNPADALSRGVMPGSLSQMKTWWSGPSWLELDRENWPQGAPPANEKDLPERKIKIITAATTTTPDPDIFYLYSNFTKLIRVVTYLFRFVEGASKSKAVADQRRAVAPPQIKPIKGITVDEQQQTIYRLVKIIQLKHFSREMQALSNQKAIPANSSILKLNPFLDSFGILRVGGRLKESSLLYAAKHPLLLPGNHPFAHLIVVHEHEKHFHAGPQATLAAVRQCYWLTSALKIIRQILRKCIICYKSSPKPAHTLMGNLPESRVKPCLKVFDKCGVDYAGPLYYKEGARKTTKLVKCYIAIFVCFATKAVHIELASNLSSEAFLNVFKRFVARRGCPSDIFSDNGLNFVGAERELHELRSLLSNEIIQQQIQDQTVASGVHWHFIPP